MFGMVPRESPYSVWTQEFVLVEHSREDSAQSARIHQCGNAAASDAAMSRPGRMNAFEQLGHATDTFQSGGLGLRYQFLLPRFDDGRRADRQQAHHGAQLKAARTPIGQTQYVVIKPVFFVPHA